VDAVGADRGGHEILLAVLFRTPPGDRIDVRVRRVISAVALAAVAAGGLSACQSQVGTAAFVGDSRISETDVTHYVGPTATSFSVSESDGTSETINPKSYALGFLVIDQLLQRGLAANGGAATNAELSALQADVLQGSTSAQAAAGFTAKGFTSAFEPLYAGVNARFDRRGTGHTATDQTVIVAALDKLKLRVRVNGRYGTWDGSQLNLVAHSAPSFLKPVTLVPDTE
jgi:hypothetical protein